jgi:hypothetical protein
VQPVQRNHRQLPGNQWRSAKMQRLRAPLVWAMRSLPPPHRPGSLVRVHPCHAWFAHSLASRAVICVSAGFIKPAA